MICEDCERTGKKSTEAFTNLERMMIFMATVSQLKFIKTSNDKAVANSIITKILLSYAPASRDELKNFARRSLGTEITLESCPHSKLSVV